MQVSVNDKKLAWSNVKGLKECKKDAKEQIESYSLIPLG